MTRGRLHVRVVGHPGRREGPRVVRHAVDDEAVEPVAGPGVVAP